MEETNDTPSQLNRFQADGMHNINIVEWKNKRKLQSDQLDLLRPKHKCWAGHATLFDENPVSESMHTVKSITDTSVIDDRSEPESAKDSNSFIEDSDTAMSANEEVKAEADCAITYFYDMQALKNNPEEHLLRSGNFSGHPYSELADDSGVHSVDKEFEDFLFSNGVNPSTYVLSSGRWNVEQEAQSSTRPPTIDQEFEQYFSMLML